MEAMKAALTFVLKWGSILAFILIPIWPLLALPATVFDEGEFFSCILQPPAHWAGIGIWETSCLEARPLLSQSQ